MPPTPSFPRRLLTPALLLLAVILAFLPARMSGYASFIGDKLTFALAPLGHPLSYLGGSIRGQFEPPPPDARALIAQWENAQEAAALIRSLQEEVAQLRLENRLLRNIHEQLGPDAGTYRLPNAHVIARGADPAAAILRLNRGSKDGVIDGIAATDGANLVGRISRAERMTAALKLISAPGTRLDVVLTPQLGTVEQMTAADAPRCQLDVTKDNQFTAMVPVEQNIVVDSFARLVDRDWPPSVQGMIVGRVTSVEPAPDDPLTWKRITVEPRVTLRYLTKVTLMIPRQE